MKPLLFLAATFLTGPAFGAEISKDDLKKALDKNPEIILDVLRSQKKSVFEIMLQAQQEEQARRQKEEEDSQKKELEDSFKNPKVPAIDAQSHVKGSKDAKFTLVEYSDFQCPYCERGAKTVQQLEKKYGSKLRVVFKENPLAFHSQALPAAQYFEAAALQSPAKAWEFHDKLFASQGQLGEPFYKETAKALGLDVKKLEADAKSKAVQERIDADMQEAKKFGFTGTPGYLLNGVPLKGAYPIESFDSIIQRLEQQEKKD